MLTVLRFIDQVLELFIVSFVMNEHGKINAHRLTMNYKGELYNRRDRVVPASARVDR